MTYYLFSLVVEPRVLLCARIVEPIRPKEYLVLCLIVRAAIGASTTGLPVAATS
jgi:hypothetical protein